jgi:hypothetical protein
MGSRGGFSWKPTLPLWKQEGKLWYCERADLEEALKPFTEDHLKRRLGYGYHHLEKALEGGRLDKFAVGIVEWALSP